METNKLREFIQKAQEWIDQQSTPNIPKDFVGKSRIEVLEEQIIELLKREMIEKKFQTRDGKINIPIRYQVTMSEMLEGKPRQLLLNDLNGFVRQQIRLLGVGTFEKEFVQLQICEAGELKVTSTWDNEYIPDIQVQTIEDSEEGFYAAETIINPNFNLGDDDETVIKPRRFYSLEISRSNSLSQCSLIPVFQQSITIGRSLGQHIRLDDPEVSRRMAVLSCEGEKTFRLVNYGVNPIVFKDGTVQTDESVSFGFEEKFQIASYLMAVKR
jgi:hypothetical protein